MLSPRSDHLILVIVVVLLYGGTSVSSISLGSWKKVFRLDGNWLSWETWGSWNGTCGPVVARPRVRVCDIPRYGGAAICVAGGPGSQEIETNTTLPQCPGKIEL